jgi:signal peptidase I
MDPLFDAGSHLIEQWVQNPEQLKVGDIASYEPDEFKGFTIVHRIIEKGYDEKGLYFVFKGDNNPTADPFRVREHELRRKVVGIIYGQ